MFPRHERKTMKLIHEGKYAAEVEVTPHYGGTDWDPTLTPADVEKLDRVQITLRRGDIKAAEEEAKVFELVPAAGD
jgi:hypothetical protein